MPEEDQSPVACYVGAGSPPSSYAIADVFEGKPGAWGRTTIGTGQRSLFILPGLWVAGIRGPKLFTGAVAGSVCITLALFGFYALRRRGVFRGQDRYGRMI